MCRKNDLGARFKIFNAWSTEDNESYVGGWYIEIFTNELYPGPTMGSYLEMESTAVYNKTHYSTKDNYIENQTNLLRFHFELEAKYKPIHFFYLFLIPMLP